MVTNNKSRKPSLLRLVLSVFVLVFLSRTFPQIYTYAYKKIYDGPFQVFKYVFTNTHTLRDTTILRVQGPLCNYNYQNPLVKL